MECASVARLFSRLSSLDTLLGNLNFIINWSYCVCFCLHCVNAAASAAAGRPVMFFCKAGKDRTGLVAALLLSTLGASEEQILQDYVISDKYHMVALAGLEENPRVTGLDRTKFERAPREAMHHALQFISEKFGGVQQYLVKAGFGLEEQEELRQLLLLQSSKYNDGNGAVSSNGHEAGHSRL